jgi:hypothetical protein
MMTLGAALGIGLSTAASHLHPPSTPLRAIGSLGSP